MIAARLDNIAVHLPWLRWAVLALGISGSLGAAYLHVGNHREAEGTRFRIAAASQVALIGARLRAYSDVLRAMRGLYDASTAVSRTEFHDFTQAMAFEERYPGIAGLSFAALVTAGERAAFERNARNESGALVKGLPVFSIKPPDPHPEYLVLQFLEPMKKHAAAWGVDLLSDPQRRWAAERALDSGEVTSISGVTPLRPEDFGVAGTILRLAVYRGGGVPQLASERRQRAIGLVALSLRIEGLVEAVASAQDRERMRLRIYAEPEATGPDSPSRLLYDSRPETPIAAAMDLARRYELRVPVGDRAWRVLVTPLAAEDPLSVVAEGSRLAFSLGLTLLLFWMLTALARAQKGGIALGSRLRESALITSLGEDLHSCLTPDEAYDVMMRGMPRLLPDSAAMLYLFDQSRARAVVAARWGTPVAVADEFASQDCQCVRRGHLYLVDDSATALNCAHFDGPAPASYVCVPLNAQGEVIGILHVQQAGHDEAHVGVITSAAQHLALSLASLGLRHKLVERATRDSLTRLYNRHYMREWFEQELHRATRAKRAIGVIMLDIDHFKRINDDFGHEAGDMVLREIAALMGRLARKSDVACRHGGEEFLLLMPEASLEDTLAKAEALRAEVERLDLVYEGQQLGTITISAGVAAYPLHASTRDTLLRRADEALYAAKGAGRNRVMASEAAIAAEVPAGA